MSAAMRTVTTVAELRAALASARADGRRIGLVPTMGAFHEGHLSLMRRARANCDIVVVSLFVNPAQFAAGEDLERYPRDPEGDRRLAEEVGVDLVYEPSPGEVYPPGFSTSVDVGELADALCGRADRRGSEHFRGVATVVTKLLNSCQPDVAYFGAKDFQQALVVKRVVHDLDLPVEIEVCPIVRDAHGLALSSRNAYLSDLERRRALALKRALDAAVAAIDAGASDPRDVAAAAERELDAPGVEPEYVEVVSASDLTPLESLDGREVLIAIAARVGGARLIDNAVVSLEGRSGATLAAASTTGEGR
jgi:pantoate--beta-alanine ligase